MFNSLSLGVFCNTKQWPNINFPHRTYASLVQVKIAQILSLFIASVIEIQVQHYNISDRFLTSEYQTDECQKCALGADRNENKRMKEPCFV